MIPHQIRPAKWLQASIYLGFCAALYPIAKLPPGTRAWAYITVHIALYIVMLWSWRTSSREKGLGGLILVGLAARLILVEAEPFTSEDVWRYLWDGAVALGGWDPYRLSPDSESLQYLGNLWHLPPSNREYVSLYPPLAMFTFMGVAAHGAASALLVWKVILTLASILSMLIMLSILRTYKREQHFSLIALNPLLILESGVGAHVDGLSLLWVSALLWALSKARFPLAGGFVGLGILTKLTPIIFLPAILAFTTQRQRLRVVTALGLVLSLGYVASLLAGWEAIGSLGTFVQNWRFGAPISASLRWALGEERGSFLAIALAGATYMGLLMAEALKTPSANEQFLRMVKAMFLGGTVFLLSSPVAFPWYWMILVPLLTVRPSWLGLLCVGAAPLSYEVVALYDSQGIWAPHPWPLWVLGTGALLGFWLDAKGPKLSTKDLRL